VSSAWSKRTSGRLACLSLACLTALAACGDERAAAPDAGPDDGHSHGGDGHSHGDGGHSHAQATDGDAALEPPDGSVIGSFVWNLPKLSRGQWPVPIVPPDNPMSDEKVELGRHLFYDTRLSKNETQSCASCHKQELAFSDGRAVGLGSTGQAHTRGSMSLANVGYTRTLTWGHPLMTALERQADVPIFGDNPVELGHNSIPALEARLREVPRYAELFASAYPDDIEPIAMINIKRALAAFQRTLISGDSAFDRYQRGEEDALSEAAKRGMVFVTSNEDHRFECNHCHGGLFFSDHATWEGHSGRNEPALYHQTGLYDIDGNGSYPAPNTGTHDVTENPADMGKFKAPSLRNIALTAPYMHDGSVNTLSDVLDHYAAGGRAHVTGKTDSLLKPFTMNAQERADIIAFLESLTDEEFITNPRFANPWP
jgi:cytochrome c peroxidase